MFDKFTALNYNKTLFQRVHFRSRILEITSSLNVHQKQRAVIEFLVLKGEPPTKIFDRFAKVYGDALIAYSTVKK